MTPAPPSAAARTQLAGPEALKLLASFGIVAFHQPTAGATIGYAGLPAFMLLTTAFASASARSRDWASFRRGRLRRLLLPWLVWSMFYAIVQCAIAAYAGASPWHWLATIDGSTLLVGTYPHLWYLPFAAAMTLLVGRLGGRGSRFVWLAAGALALPCTSWSIAHQLPQPVPQWLFVLPAALLGPALGRTPLGGGLRRLDTAVLGATAAGLAAAASLGLTAPWLQYALAAAGVVVAWSTAAPAPNWLTAAGAATFGVYVLHPFVDMLAALLAIHAAVPFTEGTRLLAVFTVALALAILLRRTPARAVL